MTSRVLFCYIVLLLGFSTHAQKINFELRKTEKPCIAGSATLVVQDTASYRVVWSNGAVGNSSGSLESGTYNFTIQSVHKNFSDTVMVFDLKVPACDIIIKQYFSPNDDGYNDVWLINRLEYYPLFSLHVYNRTGQLVFEQENEYTGWDGRGLVGFPAEDGTYYYVLFPNKKNKKEAIYGKVLLIR